MQREASGLHPSWRFRHTLNQQIVAFGNGPDKKMLINHERSLNVYENKQKHDMLPEEKRDNSTQLSDILYKWTRFLRKPSAFLSQFGRCGSSSSAQSVQAQGMGILPVNETCRDGHGTRATLQRRTYPVMY